jgi:hypothetical protein
MTDAADKLAALVRLLARQAIRDAYAAAQGMNDGGSNHDPADGRHRAATPAREEQQNSTFQPKGDL